MVVMEHHGVTDDGSLSGQGKVRVGEEPPGGGKVDGFPRHVEVGVLVLEVPDPAALVVVFILANLVNTEKRMIS